MSDLFDLLPREFDLPPKWDGRVVRWLGWETETPVWICPPPDDHDACTKCGLIAPQLVNRGEVARWANVTLERIEDREAARARLPLPLKGKLRRLAYVELVASRCTGCGHDVVVELEGSAWDLDGTDYGPEGSHAL